MLWLAAGCGSENTGAVDAAPKIDAAEMPIDAAPDAMAMIDAPVQVALNDQCANASQISLATMHSNLTVNTAGSGAELAAPCGTAGQPDVFFVFTLTRRELIYADTFGASADTALYFASSCSTALTASTTTGDAVCSTGACGTGQSQVTALLDPGTYYLVLASQGSATIHFQHAEVGTGSVAPLPQGASSPNGATSGTGSLYACDAGGAENAYWWSTCPSNPGGAFTASTCTGTDFDTILSLQAPGGDSVYCNDDTCSFQSTLAANLPPGAGLYVVAVDGFSQSKLGNYTLTTSRP